MLTGTQSLPNILSTFTPFGLIFSSEHSPKKQIQPEFVDTETDTESEVKWLVSLLDLFTDIENRNEDLSCVVVSEIEYQHLTAVLDELVYGVGGDENHPLSAVMTCIGILIKAYQEQHFPKIEALFPELVEEIWTELESEGIPPCAATVEQTETDVAAAAFFAIGYLLSERGNGELAISAYDLAICMKPDYAGAYNNRGVAKIMLGQPEAAIADFDEVIELDNDFAEVYYNRGVAYHEKGDLDGAIKDYNTAVELNPKLLSTFTND